jgi:hypothetical protein
MYIRDDDDLTALSILDSERLAIAAATAGCPSTDLLKCCECDRALAVAGTGPERQRRPNTPARASVLKFMIARTKWKQGSMAGKIYCPCRVDPQEKQKVVCKQNRLGDPNCRAQLGRRVCQSSFLTNENGHGIPRYSESGQILGEKRRGKRCLDGSEMEGSKHCLRMFRMQDCRGSLKT